MRTNNLLAVAPLFLIITIDTMGLGILFPTLGSMLTEPTAHFLSANTSNFSREMIYGLIIGAYMIACFFGAAILGDLSDGIGRKKALLICLLGAVVGYLLSAVAITFSSVTLLVIGRLIAGFTAGSQPIAQAAIIDISSDDNKTKNLAMILLAMSIGFVLGPLLGGILSDTQLASWCNYTTPFYFAAILSFVNILLLLKFFNDTDTTKRAISIRFSLAITIFADAFKQKRIRTLSIVSFFFIGGWSGYFGFISPYLIRQFHYTSLQLGLFLTTMEVALSLTLLLVVDFLSKHFSTKKCASVSLLLASLAITATVACKTTWVAWIATIIIGISFAIAYTLLITFFSNQVDRTEQGWVMGIMSAIMSLSFGATALLSGVAAGLSSTTPLAIGAACFFIATVALQFYQPKIEPFN